MADTSIGVSGVWKKITGMHIGVGGVWKPVTAAYIGVGGVWKKYWPNEGVVDPGIGAGVGIINVGDFEPFPTHGVGTLTLTSSGTISYGGNSCSGHANWYDPTTVGIGSSFWAVMTRISGDNPTSSSGMATPIQLSSNRFWTWDRASLGTYSGTFELNIYADAGATILVASDRFTVNVEMA